jgi:hypothetical protein
MLRVAQVQAAVAMLYTDLPATLHMDGTTKEQKKLGTAVLTLHGSQGDSQFAPGGVFTQATGTSKESNELTMAAVEALDDTLSKLRAFVDERGLDANVVLSDLAGFAARASAQSAAARAKETGAAPAAAVEVEEDDEPMLPARTAAEVIASTQSDHAAAQKAQSRALRSDLAERKLERDGVDLVGKSAKETQRLLAAAETAMEVVEGFCYNHKRANMASAYEKAEDKVLTAQLGRVQEFKGNVVNALLHALGKAFGHTSESYAHGVGVVKYRAYLATQAGAKWRGLLRHVGSRNDVQHENAAIAWEQLQWYLRFLLQKVGPNQLFQKLTQALATSQISTALLSRTLLWFHLHQPLRAATNSKRLAHSFADMEPFAVETRAALRRIAAEPSVLFDPEFRAFSNGDKLYEEVAAYRAKFDQLFAKACTEAASAPPLLLELLKSGAPSMDSKWSEFAADQLPGGRYSNPSVELRAKLAQLPTTNDAAERAFAIYDRSMAAIQNASQLTLAGQVAWMMQDTSGYVSLMEQSKRSDLIDVLGDFAASLLEADIAEWKEREAQQRAEQQRIEAEKAEKERTRLEKKTAYWRKLFDSGLGAASLATFDDAWKAVNKVDELDALKQQREYLLRVLKVPLAQLPSLTVAGRGAKRSTQPRTAASLYTELRGVLAKIDAGDIEVAAAADRGAGAAAAAVQVSKERRCAPLGRGTLTATAAAENAAADERVEARIAAGADGAADSDDDVEMADAHMRAPAPAAAGSAGGAAPPPAPRAPSARLEKKRQALPPPPPPLPAAASAAPADVGKKRKRPADDASILNANRQRAWDSIAPRPLKMSGGAGGASSSSSSAAPPAAAATRRAPLSESKQQPAASGSKRVKLFHAPSKSARPTESAADDDAAGDGGDRFNGRSDKENADEADNADNVPFACRICHRWRKVEVCAATATQKARAGLTCTSFFETQCSEACDWCGEDGKRGCDQYCEQRDV